MLNNKALLYLESQKSSNTIRAYSSDWRDFSDWCKQNRLEALPAKAETVANYIAELAERIRPNSISRHLTSIKQMHDCAGYSAQNPATDFTVRQIMRAIKRKYGTAQIGKAAITTQILRQMLPHIKNDIAGTRNRALLLIGFAGALRRSELVNIKLEDITRHPNGITITINKSKTDQQGKSQKIAIEYGTDEASCPIRALEKWIDRAKITEGAVFRAVTKYGFIKPHAVDDRTVALIIKHYVALAGYDPRQFSGHSLRRGYATTAAMVGASTLDIMHQTRHKSEKMVHRYIEEAEIFSNLPQIWAAA